MSKFLGELFCRFNWCPSGNYFPVCTSTYRIASGSSFPRTAMALGVTTNNESHERHRIVIPAKAGIQVLRGVLDPGLRRGDGVSEF